MLKGCKDGGRSDLMERDAECHSARHARRREAHLRRKIHAGEEQLPAFDWAAADKAMVKNVQDVGEELLADGQQQQQKPSGPMHAGAKSR